MSTNVFLKLKNANENETEILNSNNVRKTEQSTFQNDSIGNGIAGLTRNRVPERERAEAEGLIRRREGGGVGKPKCRYMRVSKTAHHPDTKMQGSTSKGRGKRKIAFTLAEVLITLGIIGIVAAMTMPTLIQKHQKKVTVTRLKHFSSMMQLGASMRSKDILLGDFKELKTDEVNKYSPEDMEKFFNIYWKPYIKITESKKLTKGLAVKLTNGSGVYFQRTYVCPEPAGVTCNSYIYFCPQYKYCEILDEDMYYKNIKIHNVFSFCNGVTVPREYKQNNYSR